jgi:hypothetical protein
MPGQTFYSPEQLSKTMSSGGNAPVFLNNFNRIMPVGLQSPDKADN